MNNRPVTTKDLAEVLGLSRNAIEKKSRTEAWPFIEIRGRGRAGIVKHFLIESLPTEIREAVQGSRPECFMALDGTKSGQNEKQLIDTTFRVLEHPGAREWREKPESCRIEGQRRLGIVNRARKVIANSSRGNKTQRLRASAKGEEISYNSLDRYMKIADQALAEAQKSGRDPLMEQIIALTPGYGGNKGSCRVFSPEALKYARFLYCEKHLNVSEVYRQVENEAKIHGWKFYGGPDALRLVINRSLDEGVKIAARQGLKRYEAQHTIKVLRDYREIWPNFMWVGDHLIFDNFIKAPGGKVLRPWLTAWRDMASRSFMGWCISFQPNSQTIALALAHGILTKEDANFPQHGLPWSVYQDNGKDYRCEYLNGEEIEIGKIDYPDTIDRFMALGIDPFYLDMRYDASEKSWIKKRGNIGHVVKKIRVGGVYSRLGLHQKFARCYHPWAKPIERSFREVVQNFSRELPGWCGSGHEQRPEKLTFEIKRGLLLSFEEFCERWYQWVVHRYHKTPQNGHGIDGRTPDEVFLSHGPVDPVDPELVAFALERPAQVRIYDWGFKLMGRDFELGVPSNLQGAAILNGLIGGYATVSYHPNGWPCRVYKDGCFVCNARPLQRASFVRGDDPVMTEKLKLQALQKKLTKDRLQQIRDEKPALIGSEEQALLSFSGGGKQIEEGRKQNVFQLPERNMNEEERIPLTGDERYRFIIERLARGEELSPEDTLWREEYESGDEYLERRHLFQAEFEYLKHKIGRRE